MLSILPLSLPPPPYDQNDNGSDKPAKQENYPNSDQKHLVGKIVVKGKIQGEDSVEYKRTIAPKRIRNTWTWAFIF